MCIRGALPVCWLVFLATAWLFPPVVSAERPGDGYDYSMIDQHALNAPAELKSSVKGLVEYLVKPARNDREKLRAIFRWITHNIAYDTEGFFAELTEKESAGQQAQAQEQVQAESRESPGGSASQISKAITPELVLQKGSADCDGYAVLTESMLSEALMGIGSGQTTSEGVEQSAGLEGILGARLLSVKGFAKGYGYRVGSDFEGTNHAWNAVELDGEWYFLDCTWGAGRPNEQNVFIREFEDYYFLTPPEELVYTHFPTDPAQQHLEGPVSREEYIKLAYLWPAFFKYGMELGNHPESVVQADSTLYLSLFARDSILMMAELAKGKQVLDESYVFIQKDTTRYDIHAVFPLTGEYLLRLYAKPKGREGAYKEILNYLVTASARASQDTGFPLVYEQFRLQQSFLYSPLRGFLAPERPQHFSLRVPGAQNVAVVVGEQWNQLERQGEQFEGEVTFEPGATAEVYARLEGKMTYEALLEYVVLEE
ncbi:MAG: hypothetical protein JXQ83_07040 [Candidatus Glassbacteria bacterium]|nr:hypothetical protein [Candidatus Glassbacteria bacterium]